MRGAEELAHLEMVGAIVYQLTRNLTPEQLQDQGYAPYFVDHTTGIYPSDASGNPFSALALASTGDTLADLHENLAAEQKARKTYDNILRFTDDPDVRDPIKFLRAREIVHYQRFGETKRTKWKPTSLDSLLFKQNAPHLQKASYTSVNEGHFISERCFRIYFCSNRHNVVRLIPKRLAAAV